MKYFKSLRKASGVVLVAMSAASASQIFAAEKTVGEINRLIVQGRREVQANRHNQAIVTFSAALRMNPDPRTAAEIYGERGGSYVDTGQLDKAMDDGDRAVQLAPGYFRGYQVRGRVLRRRKEFQRALAEFDKAMKLAPSFVQLYNNRGNVFSDMGQEERAIQDFSEAIRRAPGTIDGYVNRGGSYIVLRQYDKAIADLDRALRINPRDSDSYFDRGHAHLGKRDYPAAMADYLKARQLSPRDPEILDSIASLKATCPADSIRDGKGAVQAALEACRLTNFKELDYVATLAAAYAETGDFDRAIEYMTKVVSGKTGSTDRREAAARLALYRNREPYRDAGPNQQYKALR